MSKSEPTAALNLDITQQQTFVRYFNNLPEKPPSTVRFFNRTDYYTLHGSDATLASDFTSKALKYMGEEPKLSYICLNKKQAESLFRELLLVRQYRVEVYVKPSQGKNNDWQLEYKGSPGNLTQFDEILFENADIDFTCSVMAVKIVKTNVLAISNVNVADMKFQVCEIIDNDHFTELEALIAQIGPKECIIPSGESTELVALRTLLERTGILAAKTKRSDFNADDIIQDLNRLLFFQKGQQRNADALPETNLIEAMGCLQAAIKFLNLTGDEANFNQFKLEKLDHRGCVRLDGAALYALNVLPKPGSNISLQSSITKTSNLMGILNYCVTAQGKRLLEQWIKQPLKDYNRINERLDIVECFVRDPETRTIISKNSLTRMPDLLFLSKKLSSSKAKLQDCYKLYQAANSLPALISYLRKMDNKCVRAALIDPIGEIASDLGKYQSMIEDIVDMDMIDRGEFLVKNTVNNEISELFKNKRRVEEKMQKVLSKAGRDLGFEEGKTIKLECNNQHGYFLRVTKKEEHALRQNKSYRIIDAIAGGVRFTNDALATLNEEYSEINKQYEEEQKEYLNAVFEVAMGYADTFRNLSGVIATLDVLTSFATAAVSARIPYVRPKLHPAGTGILKLKKARHPCLEQQDHIAFIPNDVSFDKEDKTFYIITGPNMCGKSTYIRSVEVCVLMAHIGSLVPCEEAEISLVDGILARVGADDCQLKGLSTFMLEMIETSSIIKSATQNSLVIIDELGRGTSTYDGCGIAWAVAEELAKEIKCFSLFATHFHEITSLAETCPSVGNLHVTAVTTNNTITPLYQIEEGACDKSYGIHCARLAGFPEDVIEEATNHLKELEHAEGNKFLTGYDVSTKRKIIKEGNEIIKDTLKKLKSMGFENMSDEEVEKHIKAMKNELEALGNPFIKGLIST